MDSRNGENSLKKTLVDEKNRKEKNIWFYFIQIYHAWEGYLRKIPVERRKIFPAEWRGKFSLKTVIPLTNMIYLFNYTEYYLEHWLNK